MEADLRRFLAANFFLGDDPGGLPGHESLIEAGIIDSTGILELVGWLEDTYHIQVADDELVPENLESIDNIVRFVERKRATLGAA
jgi:acyl carrier protein